MRQIIDLHEKIKKTIQDDHRSLIESNCWNTLHGVDSMENIISIYFLRRTNNKKENLLKIINEKIKYYQYLYKIEEFAYRLFIGLCLICIGYSFIKLGLKFLINK